MDLESAQNNALAKLPLLKQGDYDTWRLRIESYIQLQDYALWEIIEDGNSFKPKKDKGKAIMIEDESVQKKSKKQMQKERLGHEEDIRLQEQIDEGERKRIAKDAKIAKLLKICLRILTGMI
ncbi:hypothetical protein Tco_1337979 [Tanacetum coccineum]